jgi:serine/threonine protein phosphatase PrpC
MTDQYFGITDTGRERKNNEDAFIARQGTGNKFIIACVIDGVGGYAGGEIAAGLAREAILQRLEKPSGDVISMLIDCFDLANQRIIEQKQINKEYAQMSCVSTLALADISNNQFYYAHVGDTRLYLLRDSSLVKISHDQSFVGFLEESGRLTEEEAMTHPKRNEINKALGFESHLGKNTDYIETGQSPFLSGDLLLLCSDGLTDMVNSAEITSILTNGRPLKERAQQLIDAANAHGGKDNVTVVLVQNDKVPVQHTATAIKQREPVAHDAVALAAEQPALDEIEEPAVKSSRGIITALSVLMLLFLAGTVYFYLQSRTPAAAPVEQTAAASPKASDPQVSKLQKAIDNLKGNTLILSDTGYKSPIVITDAIKINRDSLLIKARGKIVFQSDSGYAGPALKLSAKCKSIVLDSLSFSNFNTVISLTNSSLELRNVRFINCRQSIQSELAFADKRFINGKLPYLVMRSDSLPVVNRK